MLFLAISIAQLDLDLGRFESKWISYTLRCNSLAIPEQIFGMWQCTLSRGPMLLGCAVAIGDGLDLFGLMLCVSWLPHKCWNSEFSRRILHCQETVNVIYSI